MGLLRAYAMAVTSDFCFQVEVGCFHSFVVCYTVYHKLTYERFDCRSRLLEVIVVKHALSSRQEAYNL